MDEIAESDPSDDDDEAPKISSAMASRKVTRAMYQKLSSQLPDRSPSVVPDVREGAPVHIGGSNRRYPGRRLHHSSRDEDQKLYS
ncbi:hypothetical protein V7S43_003626 [Phytophthora oleae]|uniref:Uncharacterized protein n=1 Tax=Phytophthora oleae TaxID=2107226 RepID=A0ABD3FZJ6_9STRA